MNLLFEGGETNSWGEKVLKVLGPTDWNVEANWPDYFIFCHEASNQLNLTFGN